MPTSRPMVVPDGPKSTISRHAAAVRGATEQATEVAAPRRKTSIPDATVSQPEWLSEVSLGAPSVMLCEPDHSLVNLKSG
jgi:hypothetical protein